MFNYAKLFAAFLFLATCVSCGNKDDDNPQPAVEYDAWALGTNNELIAFKLSDPAKMQQKAVTGLQPGEKLAGIDIRPANNQVYGLTDQHRLYTIHTGSGAATAVGPAPFASSPLAPKIGLDFNPVVDRLRVVQDNGHNIRVLPTDGSMVTPQDANVFPATLRIAGAAYTNNKTGAASTELYAIDLSTSKLIKFTNPNAGVTVAVGPLGVTPQGVAGFDITGADNKAYAALTGPDGKTKLYRVNLATGQTAATGEFAIPIAGLALTLEK